jgi:hypothetical protein
MAAKRWPDVSNAILGLWLALSPWVLGFAVRAGAAAGAAWILGATIVVFSGVALVLPEVWEEGLTLLLGLCLSVSPWALSYADQPGPTANAVAVGVLVTLLALWARLRDQSIVKAWHERHAPRSS